MKNFKLTLIGLAISLSITLGLIYFEIDLFEKLIEILEYLKKFEVDEFIISLSILGTFALFDLLNRQRSQRFQIEFEKRKVYIAMMSSFSHIINNFLNQLQFFKMIAEEIPEFDPDILSCYDQVAEEVSRQVDALGSISNINETSIITSVAPQSNIRASTQQINKPD